MYHSKLVFLDDDHHNNKPRKERPWPWPILITTTLVVTACVFLGVHLKEPLLAIPGGLAVLAHITAVPYVIKRTSNSILLFSGLLLFMAIAMVPNVVMTSIYHKGMTRIENTTQGKLDTMETKLGNLSTRLNNLETKPRTNLKTNLDQDILGLSTDVSTLTNQLSLHIDQALKYYTYYDGLYNIVGHTSHLQEIMYKVRLPHGTKHCHNVSCLIKLRQDIHGAFSYLTRRVKSICNNAEKELVIRPRCRPKQVNCSTEQFKIKFKEIFRTVVRAVETMDSRHENILKKLDTKIELWKIGQFI